MRRSTIQALLLLGSFLATTGLSADERPIDDQCTGREYGHACVGLGEIRNSLLVAGTFKSCSEEGFSEPLLTDKNVASSTLYQFNLVQSGLVKLDFEGLGEVQILKGTSPVYRTTKYVASVKRHFESGEYVLIARAAPCGNSESDWVGAYRLEISPHSMEDSVFKDAENTDDTRSELTQPPVEPLESRVTKWVMGALLAAGISALIFFLIVAGSHTA